MVIGAPRHGASQHSRLPVRLPRTTPADLAFWAMVLGFAAISLLLRARSPMWLQSNFNVDYGLFGQLAGSLADHQWLGAFDGRNLVKGPSYSMFIYASYRAHIPIMMAEQLLYLFASAVMGTALGRLGRSRWLGGTAFAVLAINPIHLGAVGSELIREVFYTSVSILLIGSVLLLVSFVPALARTRYGWGYAPLAVGGGFIGLVAAVYYLCREEREWIAPALLIAVAAGIWGWRRHVLAVRPRVWAGLLVVLLVAGLTCYAGVNYVVQRNKQVYGAGIISDNTDGQLPRAYVWWQSVEAGPRVRHIPVPLAARQAVYRVSPAAAELEPFLEGSAQAWARLRCKSQPCDYLGAFFIWALREAITDSGHLQSEVALQQFSRQLADEIAAACHNHKLTCGSRGLFVVPAIRTSDIGPILSSAADTTGYILSFHAASPKRFPLSGGTDSTWTAATRAIPDAQNQKAFQAEERLAITRQGPVSALETAYRWLAYPALVFGLLGLLWELIRPRRDGRRAVAVALIAVLVALLARIAVITIIDAMSYTTADYPPYAIPGSDLFVLLAAAGCWIFGAHVYDALLVRRSRQGGSPELVAEPEDRGRHRSPTTVVGPPT